MTVITGNDDKMKDVRQPRQPSKRKKETVPRKQPEAEIRNDIIKGLRAMGVKVMRIENSIGGKNNTGIADLLVFSEYRAIGGFMEVKAPNGRLTGNQPEFRRLCLDCGINYWVVQSLEEAKKAIKK